MVSVDLADWLWAVRCAPNGHGRPRLAPAVGSGDFESGADGNCRAAPDLVVIRELTQ